ncbi:MAG: PP2C family protein-serine/threonine phosphatase [Clostridia bacterium]
MKKRKLSKLSHKLIIGFVLLGVLISASSCTIGYIKYKGVIETFYNDRAYDIAGVASSYINGDSIERYLKTNTIDDEYNTTLAKLNALHDSMHVNYIYVAKLEDTELTYVLDADNENDEYESYKLGDKGKINPEFREDAHEILETGKRSKNYFYSKSQFGYNTSAIVPIYNSKKEIVAIAGVEVMMSTLKATLSDYLLYVIIITSVLILVFILIYLLYLRITVIVPIDTMTSETKLFIEKDTKISKILNKIKTGDEIELLSKSIYKMEIDINEYINNLTKITAEKERIGAELNVATQIQADMLPSIFPAFPGRPEFDIFATMQPAKEVGGDFYDFFLIDDDHLAIVIADVSGKGVPAALFMVIAKTLIKNHTQNKKSAAEIFTNTNEQLCENNKEGMFVTGWMGILEITTGKFIYVNAGHNPPLIKRQNGEYEYLKSRPGFVLAGMEGVKYKQNEMQLNVGDSLYLYTDGVTEATNASEKLYGEDRLQNILNLNINCSPEEILKVVKTDIDKFVGEAPQFDDITMLAIEYKGNIKEEM